MKDKYFVAYTIIPRLGVQGGVGSTVIAYDKGADPEVVFRAAPKAIADTKMCQEQDVIISAFNRL